jgi:hypothetical protein
MYEKLQPVLKKAQKCHDKWSEKNAGSSVLKHYNLFDPIIAEGELGLRALYCMLRGRKAAWVFGVISQIIKNLGLPPVELEKEDYGNLRRVRSKYESWGEKHLQPTLIELHWSAMFAEEMANEFWYYVITPSTRSNYGGTYFSGSLEQAIEYGKIAEGLRQRAKALIETQVDQWKDNE